MSKRITVLHFLPLFDTGGIEKVVVDIYKGLDRERFTSHVCTFFPGEYDRLFDRNLSQRHVLVPETGRPAGWPTTKAWNFWMRLKRLRRAIRQSRADIVHTHSLGPLLHVYLLRQTVERHLLWMHTEHAVLDLAAGYAQPIFRWLKPLSAPAIVTGVSSNVCRYFETDCGLPKEKIKLIPNGVDIERLTAPLDRLAVRRELGLSAQDEVVGCIGNLRKEKNQRLALEAVNLLRQQRPGIKLIICGNGDQRAALESLAADLGLGNRVLFLGVRLDIECILAAMDLFCLPSEREGMPLSVLEAWAAGKPVVATDVIGINDLVTNGVNGLLAPAGDPQGLADTLAALLDNRALQLQLVGNGRQMVAGQYSLRAMVSQYAACYQQLTGN